MRFSTAVLAAVVLLARANADGARGDSAPAEYQARRAALAHALGPDTAFIAFSSEPARRTGDIDSTHDVYDRARPYEAGMVFTNEPGVDVRKDDILDSAIFKALAAARTVLNARRAHARRRHRDPDRRRCADYQRRAQAALSEGAEDGERDRRLDGFSKVRS